MAESRARAKRAAKARPPGANGERRKPKPHRPKARQTAGGQEVAATKPRAVEPTAKAAPAPRRTTAGDGRSAKPVRPAAKPRRPRARRRAASGREPKRHARPPRRAARAVLNEEDQIRSAKYLPRDLPARLFEEERFLFPESYGVNRVRLLVKDPEWLFAHWDVDPKSLGEHEEARWASAPWPCRG